MKWLTFSILMMTLTWGLRGAAQAASCDRLVTHYDNLQISREVLSPGVCFVSVDPRNATHLVYRSYLMTTTGHFMVFNSYGEDESSQSTGAREYYFFPRGPAQLDVIPNLGNKEVTVRYGSGQELTFSTETAELKKISGAQFKIDPEVKPGNKGGVEITSFAGLLMDVGFAIGQSPAESPKRQSTFSDSHGQSCQILNRDLFKYSKNDVDFVMSDADLKQLLERECKHLQIDF